MIHLVLGATGGIGAELSRRLAASGESPVLVARDRPRLEELGQELDAPAFPADATNPDEVEEIVRDVVQKFGSLDGIANCVGSLLLRPAHSTSVEDWEQTLATNLGSAFAAVRSAARALEGPASVVLFSSAAARIGMANHEALAAAKAGVVGLMLSAAATYAQRGLRFNAIAPGLVRTAMTARLTATPAVEEASASMHALGRIGEPKDVASLAAWLLGEESGWVTGQTFGVDGGLATLRAHPMTGRRQVRS